MFIGEIKREREITGGPKNGATLPFRQISRELNDIYTIFAHIKASRYCICLFTAGLVTYTTECDCVRQDQDQDRDRVKCQVRGRVHDKT